MSVLTNLLVVACLGGMPGGPVVCPAVPTIGVVPDGGTVWLGGLKGSAGSVDQPAAVVPDGGTVLLGGLKRLR
jgi:hypothetical protein